MSDKLKLTDGHGDAEIEKIAEAKEMDEVNRRVRELEQNIARLKALQAERERAAREAAAPTSAGNNKIGARKHAGFKAISTAPSINKTPIGPSMVPLPYPTVQDLSNSASPARSVRFNGAPAYLLDGTTQPKCTGDEPGSGKGIRSGTVSGEVKPVKGSSTVRIEGKQVVREGDACTMNGGNNPGIYVTTLVPSSASPKDAIKTSHPPTTLDTPEEKSAFRKWLAQAEDDIRQAAKHPVEGVKGAAKGIVNIVPGTMELLLKVSAEQRATELDESAMTLGIFGQTGAATTLSGAASGARKNADNTDLPKLTMSNQAQKGGDTISTAIQLFAAGVGILKGGAKLLGGLGKAGKAAEAAEAAKAAEVASGVGKIDKATGAVAGPAGDGVKIAGANSVTGDVGELAKLNLSERHFLGRLSIPKATGNSLFFGSREAAMNDLAEIQSGAAIRTGELFKTSSGRIWGTHNSSVHPVSGPDIVNVSSQEYKILVQAQKQGAEKALLTLEKMTQKNLLTPEQAARTKNIINIIRSKKGD